MKDISKIKEHMDVVGSDGRVIGKVDHMEGKDKIKLTKDPNHGGHHHLISASLVDHVDQKVHLNKSGQDVMKTWEHAA